MIEVGLSSGGGGSILISCGPSYSEGKSHGWPRAGQTALGHGYPAAARCAAVGRMPLCVTLASVVLPHRFIAAELVHCPCLPRWPTSAAFA